MSSPAPTRSRTVRSSPLEGLAAPGPARGRSAGAPVKSSSRTSSASLIRLAPSRIRECGPLESGLVIGPGNGRPAVGPEDIADRATRRAPQSLASRLDQDRHVGERRRSLMPMRRGPSRGRWRPRQELRDHAAAVRPTALAVRAAAAGRMLSSPSPATARDRPFTSSAPAWAARPSSLAESGHDASRRRPRARGRGRRPSRSRRGWRSEPPRIATRGRRGRADEPAAGANSARASRRTHQRAIRRPAAVVDAERLASVGASDLIRRSACRSSRPSASPGGCPRVRRSACRRPAASSAASRAGSPRW